RAIVFICPDRHTRAGPRSPGAQASRGVAPPGAFPARCISGSNRAKTFLRLAVSSKPPVPGTHLDIEGPAAPRLEMGLVIGLRQRRDREQPVLRGELGISLHPVLVADAAIEREMRDVNAQGKELPRHALGHT